jgi:small-conductance mechanosensitive channel
MLTLTVLHNRIDSLKTSCLAAKFYPAMFWCCLLFIVSLSSASPVLAVGNPLTALAGKNPETSQAPAAATELTDKEIDESRAKLEARSAQVRQQYGPDALAALRKTYQSAASPEELENWEKLSGKLAGILEDHSTTLFRYKNYRKTTRDRLGEMKSWKGFPEKPPYPLSLVDSLRDALHSKKSVLKSLDVIRSTIESEFEEFSANLKKSSKQIRLAQEELEKATGGPGEQRSSWLLQLAQLQHALNQAGTVYGEARRLSAAELQKGVQLEVDFLNRKLTVARENYRFTAEDLEQKLRAIDAQLTKARQALELAKGEENEARGKLDGAELATSGAQTLLAAGGRPKIPVERLLREQKRWQVRFDAASMRVMIAQGLYRLLLNEKVVWQERFILAGGSGTRKSPDDADELKNRKNELDYLAKWKDYVTNKLNVVELQIKSQQEELTTKTLNAASLEDGLLFLAIYREQEALLQRGILFLSNYEQLLQRRNEEAKRGKVSLEGQVSGTFSGIASLAKSFWNTELYVAEETIIVDNQKIVRPRSITIAKVVEAVLILLIGIWAIRHLKRVVHWLAIHRLKFDQNSAQLCTKLMTYLMFIAILVSALIFVNIPLAVFTFFGGALAIGIGFGAQTLINNFISGLILMFGRTIRVGDMVEVDGHRGRVASIGMRSSSVKRFDGVEMLVPNSVFLQQNVINWTSSDPRGRYTVSVGVAYGSPTREVDRVILSAVQDQPEVLSDPPPFVVFDNFADSSLNFTAYFWIELDPEVNTLLVFSDIRHRINERLAKAGIVIPFPQRDLHLDSARPLEIRMIDPG